MSGKGLVIGRGQIGTALFEILKNHHETHIRDVDDLNLEGVEFLHICFPFSKTFVDNVKNYKEKYKPKYTIIHSTVPVGTATQCNAFHSPVRGIHPNLVEGIENIVKYLAPANPAVKDYFERAGIMIKEVDKPENTEALKLWSTTQYGLSIVLEKEIHKWCKENGLDFDVVYTEANRSYNEGYKKLGMGHFNRPVLKQVQGKIGGTCVIPNCKILDSFIARFIMEYNKKIKIEES